MKSKFLGLFFLLLINCQRAEKRKQFSDTVSTAAINPVSDSVIQAPKEEIATEVSEEDEITDFGMLQKAEVSKKDSVFWVNANINSDYQIFGYEQADTSSRKLIVFSVFTSDVKDNPYQCPLGAYYGSYGLEDSQIKYTGELESFIVADFIKDGKATRLYFDKNWVEFTE